jgi:hypothetical protein
MNHPVCVAKDRPEMRESRAARNGRWFLEPTRVMLASAVTLLCAGVPCLSAKGDDIQEFLRGVVTESRPASARAVAEQNILNLDRSMMQLYEDSLEKYKGTLRDQAPIILALFSEGGGRMILYRPRQEPLVAEPVPLVYPLAKSVAHSSMAIYQIVAPYVGDPSDRSWRGPMQANRARCQSALDGVGALEISDDDRVTLGSILEHNVAFMDSCLAHGTFTYAEIEKFTRDLKPYIPKAIAIAAHAQVAHWMAVIADWKKALGNHWERTYAVTNSLYVTRQNNILFTILAQFMGQEAIGDRLLLFETTEFSTSPEKMLDLLTRIVSDRVLGNVFFKDYYLMDAELVGGGARKAIAAEAARLGMKPLLPPLAPFHSHDWPWKTDPNSGKGPSSLDEIK